MDKAEARKLALENRKNIDQSMASSKVLDVFLSNKIIDSYNNVGIYYPIGKEINIMGLVDKYPNINFYLPITRDDISFVKYNNDTKLVKGPFHTMEPIGEIVDRDIIECFIIPCVGLTKDNKRIGYGKGYYDRYLKDYKGIKIGIIYDNAVFNILGDSFDISIDTVIKG